MVYIHTTFVKIREKNKKEMFIISYNLQKPVWHKRLPSLDRKEGFYQNLYLTDAQYLPENSHFHHSSFPIFPKKTLSAYSFS